MTPVRYRLRAIGCAFAVALGAIIGWGIFDTLRSETAIRTLGGEPRPVSPPWGLPPSLAVAVLAGSFVASVVAAIVVQVTSGESK